MTLAPKIELSLAVIGGGVVRWAEYGSLVYFDTLTTALIGCFLQKKADRASPSDEAR